MARLKPPHDPAYWDLTGVRLYREDVDDILRLAREAGGVVELSDDTHEFESLDDVIALRGMRPSHLTIEAKAESRRLFRLRIDRRRAQLSSGYESAFKPSLDMIRSILIQRRAPVAKLLDPWWIPFATWPLAIGALVLPTAYAAAAYASVVIFVVVTLITYYRAGGILLTHRHAGGFWRRNANAIALLVLGAMIGGVIKAAFDIAQKHWSKP